MPVRAGMVTLIDRLRSVIGDPASAAPIYSAWQALHAYVLGDYRRPTVANGHYYRVIVAGTSGAVQPTFPTNGGSVIDGTAVWADQGAIPSGSAVFTDEEIQAALDERRSEVSAIALLEDAVLSGSATVFRAPFGPWESDAVIASSTGVVTPDVSDPLNGVWSFTTAPGTTLYLSGRTYDVWGTAANLLEQWAAKVALEFDFGTDQQSFDRSQKGRSLLAVAREFGRRAIPPGVRQFS